MAWVEEEIMLELFKNNLKEYNNGLKNWLFIQIAPLIIISTFVIKLNENIKFLFENIIYNEKKRGINVSIIMLIFFCLYK